MYGFEKNGGLPREERQMEAFQKALEDCNLVYMGYSGNWFTWGEEICRKRTFKKD